MRWISVHDIYGTPIVHQDSGESHIVGRPTKRRIYHQCIPIKDIGKPEKPKATTPQVVLDQVNPPLVHDNHGGDDDAEDSDDATEQGSTSEGHDEPSEEDDDSDDGDDNPPDSPPPVQQLRRSGRDPVPSTK